MESLALSSPTSCLLIRNKSPSWPTSTQTLASMYHYHQFPCHYLHYVQFTFVWRDWSRDLQQPHPSKYSVNGQKWIWKHHASLPPCTNILIHPSSLSPFMIIYDSSFPNPLHASVIVNYEMAAGHYTAFSSDGTSIFGSVHCCGNITLVPWIPKASLSIMYIFLFIYPWKLLHLQHPSPYPDK